MNITTPLIYGGGISNLKNASQVINLGADRILIETAVLTKYKDVQDISLFLGSQALVLSLPVMIKKRIVKYYNYHNKKIEDFNKNIFLSIKDKLFSEIMIIDPMGNGFKDRFNETLIKNLSFNLPLICFGGIHSNLKINKIFKNNPKVNAIAVGNSLNYKEHAVQKIKDKTKNKKFRKGIYISE